jgi:arginine-tRNA-protein transferase
MKGRKLDLLLSKGYYRMQQDMFTCRFLDVDDVLCPVHWLRLATAMVRYGPKQARLLRINEKFSVAIKPFVLTNEIETLYTLYKGSIDFDTYNTVEACLMDGATISLFDTYAVEVRDGNTLIAVGVFDNGERSIAGILNVYHPEYHRQSLGKYLMLLKLKYAQSQQKDYYYPGYLVSNYPKFDYKLFACEAATEVYDESRDQWLPFSWEIVNLLAANKLAESKFRYF